METLNSSLFWGLFIILIGVLLIVENFTNIKIPTFRIAIAFLLIYWGIAILAGNPSYKDKNNVIFEDKKIEAVSDQKDYNVIFGRAVVDLTSISLDKKTDVEVNAVFGSSLVKIKKDNPVKIKMSSAFAGGKLPNGNIIAFGEQVYESKNLNLEKPYLNIEANAVFGEIKIEEE